MLDKDPERESVPMPVVLKLVSRWIKNPLRVQLEKVKNWIVSYPDPQVAQADAEARIRTEAWHQYQVKLIHRHR